MPDVTFRVTDYDYSERPAAVVDHFTEHTALYNIVHTAIDAIEESSDLPSTPTVMATFRALHETIDEITDELLAECIFDERLPDVHLTYFTESIRDELHDQYTRSTKEEK